MKLPRDLAKALKKLGYVQTRQSSSHIRLMSPRTLAKILCEVARHHKPGPDELLELLFQ